MRGSLREGHLLRGNGKGDPSRGRHRPVTLPASGGPRETPSSSRRAARATLPGMLGRLRPRGITLLLLLAAGCAVGCGAGASAAPGGPATDRFDADRAFAELRAQVEMGPRPAGSATSRRLASRLRARLPRRRVRGGAGRTAQRDRAPGGRRGADPDRSPLRHQGPARVRGRQRRRGRRGGGACSCRASSRADGTPASGSCASSCSTARRARADRVDFLADGLRGSRVHAARHAAGLRAMVLVDLVADRDLRIPRESSSDAGLWRMLRGAARAAGAARVFPDLTGGLRLRRPHALPGGGRPVDRPHRLRLPPLPLAPRHPRQGVAGQPRHGGGDARRVHRPAAQRDLLSPRPWSRRPGGRPVAWPCGRSPAGGPGTTIAATMADRDSMNGTSFDYDLIAIGSGPGGQRAAIQAAKLGKRVAVVERTTGVGGVCVRTGTIPSQDAARGRDGPHRLPRPRLLRLLVLGQAAHRHGRPDLPGRPGRAQRDRRRAPPAAAQRHRHLQRARLVRRSPHDRDRRSRRPRPPDDQRREPGPGHRHHRHARRQRRVRRPPHPHQRRRREPRPPAAHPGRDRRRGDRARVRQHVRRPRRAGDARRQAAAPAVVHRRRDHGRPGLPHAAQPHDAVAGRGGERRRARRRPGRAWSACTSPAASTSWPRRPSTRSAAPGPRRASTCPPPDSRPTSVGASRWTSTTAPSSPTSTRWATSSASPASRRPPSSRGGWPPVTRSASRRAACPRWSPTRSTRSPRSRPWAAPRRTSPATACPTRSARRSTTRSRAARSSATAPGC